MKMQTVSFTAAEAAANAFKNIVASPGKTLVFGYINARFSDDYAPFFGSSAILRGVLSTVAQGANGSTLATGFHSAQDKWLLATGLGKGNNIPKAYDTGGTPVNPVGLPIGLYFGSTGNTGAGTIYFDIYYWET